MNRDPDSNSSSARLVWVAVGVSALGGLLTIAILLAGIASYKRQQSLADAIQQSKTEHIHQLEHSLFPFISAWQRSLSGNESPPADLVKSVCNSDGDNRVYRLCNQIADFVLTARAVRGEMLDISEALSSASASAEGQIDRLMSETESCFGECRLDAADKLHAVRASQAGDVGVGLEADFRRIGHAREIEVELLEIHSAYVSLLATDTASKVDDLLKNQLKPRLTRLKLLVAKYPSWKARLLADFDELESLVVPGGDAAKASTPCVAGIVKERIRINSKRDDALDEAAHIHAQMARLSHAMSDELSSLLTSSSISMSETLRRTLVSTVITGVLAIGIMIGVSRRVSRTIHDQFRAVQLARTQAEAATIAKSNFLSNMSHEIRTPMTAILGFADQLLEPDQSPSTTVNAVNTIRRNGEHLLSIINDILDISKIEAGRMTVERIDCHPCDIVAEAASLMKARADEKKLSIKFEYLSAIPEKIKSDPVRLKQILFNLMGNAIKFTESGEVRLATRFVNDDAAPRLEFEVIDSGIGMTPDQEDKLFRPFMQADTSTTRQFGGTGLGLAISKRLAHLLDGDIVVARSVPGEGTTFRVTIGVGDLNGVKMIDDPTSVTTIRELNAGQTVSSRPLEGAKLLLAEDGIDNQRLIRHILVKAGATVEVVENGLRAFETAIQAVEKNDRFDVILMDMQMPVMDGYEATGRLRRHGYELPIIALTAHAMTSDRDKCIASGCDDYATKPINKNLLIKKIISAMALKPAMTC